MSLRFWAGRSTRALLRTSISGVLCAALAVGLVAASAAPSSAINALTIDGSYTFNGNGWTGTITVSNSAGGYPAIAMDYDGRADEYLSGTWSSATGTLTIYRPLSGGASQSYTLYEGNHNPSSPVFGGYFTESDTGTQRYGTYATDYLPLNVPRPPITPTGGVTMPLDAPTPGGQLPIFLRAYYIFDGNGWGGELLLWPGDPGYTGDQTQMYYNELGYWQLIDTYSWDPATSSLTLVRPIGGGVTQTYTLYIGTHNATYPMLGGYFTQSDTPGRRFAAFAHYDFLAGHGG